MTRKLNLVLALALSTLGVSAQAAEQYFMRVPAPAKCAGSSCVMHAPVVGGGGTAPTVPDKKPAASGLLRPVTSTDFGRVALGDGSALHFTFQNTGSEALENVNVSVSGPDMVFTGLPRAVNTCGRPGAPVTLAAGATCKLYTSYLPTSLGAKSGTVSVTASGAQVAALALTGDAGIATPVLSANAVNGIDFGIVALNTTSTRTLTLSNTGDANLSHSTNATGARDANVEWSMTSSCPLGAPVAPGSSCTFTISVTPRVAGQHNFPWNIQMPGKTFDIPLSATAQ